MSDQKIDKEQLFEEYLGVLQEHVRNGEPVIAVVETEDGGKEPRVVGRKWNAQMLRQVLDMAKHFNLGLADPAKAVKVLDEMERRIATDDLDFPDDPLLPPHLRVVK